MIFTDPGQIIAIIHHDTTRLRHAVFRLVSIGMNRANKRPIIQMKPCHRITRPRDAVARFHLNNGALVGAVHANADKSKNGMAQSCGVMVNYRYDLSRISENHEAFANQQTVIAEKSVKMLAAEIEITDRAI